MNNLKPCVMCGSICKDLMGYDYHKVSCSNEYCAISHLSLTKEEWNQRAQPTIADYLEANKDMLDKTKCRVVTVESLKKFGGLK